MKSEKLYEDWKKQRCCDEAGHDFTEKVMKQVYQYEQRRKSPLFDIQGLIETITAHPLVKAAMIAIGAIVGFIRFALMLYLLLYT